MRKLPNPGKHLWKIAATAALFLLLTIALYLLAFPPSREPVYQGKTATQWIDQLQPSLPMRFADPKFSLASQAITNLGAAALPAIADILDPSKDPSASLSRLQRIAIRLRLRPNPSPSTERQIAAVRAAHLLAEKCQVDLSPLAPTLIHHFTNNTILESIHGRALAHAGPRAIAFLTNYVTSTNQTHRLCGAAALHHAPLESPVFESLLRLSGDPSIHVAALALSSLSRAAPAQPGLLIPLALKALQPTNHVSHRSAALDVLAACKSDPRAREALARSLADTNEHIRAKTLSIIANKNFRRISDPR